MPMIDIRQDGLDPGWILATMHFPADVEMRRSYYSVNFVDAALKTRGEKLDIAVSNELLSDLVRAPSMSRLREFAAENAKRAYVAGDMFLSVFVMNYFPNYFDEPSIRKAIFFAQENSRESGFGDGTKLPKSDRAIRKCFDEFKSVAHLWAAVRLHEAYPIRKHVEFLESPDAVRDLLGIAGTFQDFGSCFIPKRSKLMQPLLDAQSLWSVPDWADRLIPPWECPPTWFIETAAKYKSKRKTY